MAGQHITVIGASNVDINATSYASLILSDSNPGKVQTSFGGVGRNIAENLIRMRQNVHLISAYGDDAFASLLKQNANDLSMDISESFCGTGVSSPLYICVNRPDGDMAVAISDMFVCNFLTPEFLGEKLSLINQSEAVIVDTNLPESAIAYVAEHCKAPLFADTVSTTKAVRLRPVLSRFTGIKTNRSEAALLTGISIKSEQDALLAAQTLHKMGIKYVMLTLGSRGALVSDGKAKEIMPPMTNVPVNTTGCGDAFFAGAICELLKGGSCKDMLRHGLGMAALCAANPRAVSPEVSPENLEAYLKHYEEVSQNGYV